MSIKGVLVAILALVPLYLAAETAKLSERELSDLMDFQTWRFRAEGALSGKSGWNIVLVAKGRRGNIDESLRGTVEKGEDAIVILQNADRTTKDISFYIKHAKETSSGAIASIRHAIDDAEILRQSQIHSVICNEPIQHGEMLVLYYRPHLAWDWANDGTPPVFDPQKHEYIGIRFSRPEEGQ